MWTYVVLLIMLALAVASFVHRTCTRKQPTYRTGACETVALRDGRTLGFARFGVKDPTKAKAVILYLHGLCGSRLEAVMDGGQQLLREGVCWIGVDRPGVGLSSPHRKRTVLSFGADIEELLDHLRITRCSLIGFSSGASYVHSCVFRFNSTDRTNHRIVTATTIGAQGPYYAYDAAALKAVHRLNWMLKWGTRVERTWWLRWLGVCYYAYLRTTFFWNPKKAASNFFGSRLYNASPETGQALVDNLRACFSGGGVDAGGRIVPDELVTDLFLPARDWGFPLSSLRAKYFIHHGQSDKLRPLEESRFTADHLAGATAVQTFWHESAGHALHFRAELFTQILQQITAEWQATAKGEGKAAQPAAAAAAVEPSAVETKAASKAKAKNRK